MTATFRPYTPPEPMSVRLTVELAPWYWELNNWHDSKYWDWKMFLGPLQVEVTTGYRKPKWWTG